MRTCDSSTFPDEVQILPLPHTRLPIVLRQAHGRVVYIFPVTWNASPVAEAVPVLLLELESPRCMWMSWFDDINQM